MPSPLNFIMAITLPLSLAAIVVGAPDSAFATGPTSGAKSCEGIFIAKSGTEISVDRVSNEIAPRSIAKLPGVKLNKATISELRKLERDMEDPREDLADLANEAVALYLAFLKLPSRAGYSVNLVGLILHGAQMQKNKKSSFYEPQEFLWGIVDAGRDGDIIGLANGTYKHPSNKDFAGILATLENFASRLPAESPSYPDGPSIVAWELFRLIRQINWHSYLIFERARVYHVRHIELVRNLNEKLPALLAGNRRSRQLLAAEHMRSFTQHLSDNPNLDPASDDVVTNAVKDVIK